MINPNRAQPTMTQTKADLSVALVVLVLFNFTSMYTAAVYTVGDTAGWDISADLISWPAGKNFYVGDVLSFQYSSYHTVNQVSKEDYDNCSTSNPILTNTNGNATVPLTTTGDKYFICGVSSHCFGGMRLHINVKSRPISGPAGSPTVSTGSIAGGPVNSVDPSNRSGADLFPSAASCYRGGLGVVGSMWSVVVMLWLVIL